jgi:septal ring factor EnvC (AmiA/AmiB activator)
VAGGRVTPGTAAALLLAALAAGPGGSRGQPPPDLADDQLRLVSARRDALEQELRRLRSEERSVLGEVERLDLEVRLRDEERREAELRLARATSQLQASTARARALEDSVDRLRPVLARRARSLYKLGDLSYLRLLLSVERPSDLARGWRFVTALARQDRLELAGFRADLRSLAATRAELRRRAEEASASRARLLAAQRRLDRERAGRTARLTEIVSHKESRAQFLADLQEAETRLRERLAAGAAEGSPPPVAAVKGALAWPAPGSVRVGFGRRRHPVFGTSTPHNGIEIAAAEGETVRAVHDGEVVFAERFRGYGLLVVVDHGGRHHTLYGHLGSVSAAAGTRLRAGEALGTVGPPADQPAGLYFEVRVGGRPEDPLDWLRPAGDVP